MAEFLVRIVVNALALILAVKFVPHIKAPTELWQLIVVALIFGVINAYLKPIVKMLSLPLNLLTFGLVGFVINAAMVLLVAFISGQAKLGFAIAGWPGKAFTIDVIVWAVVLAIVISIVSALLAFVRFVVPRM